MTINEIAAMADVSRATVSRYLNNGYVSAEKRERIRRVIEETGYRPSIQAQLLRAKRTGFIAVIVPQISKTPVSRMVQGICSVLNKRNYQVLLFDTGNDIKEELSQLKRLNQNHADGIIFTGTFFSKEHYRIMKEMQIPFVVLSQHVKDYSCVYDDDYGAARELTKLALAEGENPAYIGTVAEDETVGRERLYGFLDANLELERPIREEYCITGAFTMEEGYESAKRLFAMDSTIDTLICATDTIAMGAMMYIKELRKKIPQEVQIAGFGDSPMSRVCEPRLTTVHYYDEASGEEAAKMLVDMIEAETMVRKEMKMGCRIMEGGSLRNRKKSISSLD